LVMKSQERRARFREARGCWWRGAERELARPDRFPSGPRFSRPIPYG